MASEKSKSIKKIVLFKKRLDTKCVIRVIIKLSAITIANHVQTD